MTTRYAKVGAGGGGGSGDASAAKQDAQTAILTTIDGDTGAIAGLLTSMDADTSDLASMVQARSSTPGATKPGLMAYGVRDDALSASADAEDEASPFLLDANGALWVQLAGALSSLVDSVRLGLPAGATAVPYKYLRVTTASAGVDVWDPTLDHIAVKWYTITWQGANACRITLWQGANADTAFTDGTDRVLFDINLDANANGGVTFAFPADLPWVTDTDDHEIHLTTSADKIVSIVMGGYETDVNP